jgi:bile acid-coenzyme A ligase
MVAIKHVMLDGSEPELTWAEIDRRTDQLAVAFIDRGLTFGSRLAIGLRNSPLFVLSVFAAWKAGAVPVPVRWDVPAWELARIREVIDPGLFVGGDDIEWLNATAGDPVREIPDVVSPHTNGICSSGSTGTPKVIVNLRPAVYDPYLSTPFITAWKEVPRPQKILVPAPMYHTNGFTTWANAVGGEQLVILEKFDAALIVDLIERERISHFTATPTMLKRIADIPGIESRDLSSVEWIMQGAAPMPPSLVHRWAKLIGAESIVMAYGMTENLGLTALRGDEWMTHQGSVGRPFRGTEIRIRDDRGQDLPPGKIGEVYLRASFHGGYEYLGNATKLQEHGDGFGTAGDLGRLDEDGFLYLADRRVDMIITGGANVFPAEVEAALIDHPEIADVVVVGLRDPEWGRRVHAVIQPRDLANPPSAQEVIAYAKSRLAPYKVPKTVEYLDALPRSQATKISRGALVAQRGG